MNSKITISVATLALSMLCATGAEAQSNDGSEADVLEEVVVTGIRRSLQDAADRKRFSSEFQDGISAEDLGKFPDQNVVESLQRVTGVSIDRVNGEGSEITVRAFGPEFNIVRMNGRTLASVARGRAFDFRVLASELITGVDVVKSPNASMWEGSIGGAVNVRTFRPLDSPGLQVSATVEGQYNDLSEQTTPRYSALFSNTWANNTLGFAVSASFDDWERRTDQVRGVWDTVSFDTDGDGESETYRAPVRLRYLLVDDQRERFGLTSVLQWEPTDRVSTSVDVFYTSYDREVLSHGVNTPLQFSGFENAVISENDSVLAADKTFGPLDIYFDTDNADTETFAIGWNTQFEGDGFNWSADVSYSDAEVLDNVITLAPGIREVGGVPNTVRYDTRTGDVPSLISMHSVADPANVRSHFNNIEPTNRTDEVFEVRLDGEKSLDGSFFRSIQGGVFYTDREQDNQIQTLRPFHCTIAGVSLCGRLVDLTDSLFSVTNTGDFLSQEAGDFPREFTFANDINAYIAELRSIIGTDQWGIPIDNATASSLNTESTLGAYIQANIGGDRWSGNFGLRYVETDSTSDGFGNQLLNIEAEDPTGANTGLIYTFSELVPLSFSTTYSDVLPSLNLTFELEDWIQFRVAAAKVITRPTMDARNVASSISGNFESVSQVAGNPLLEPFEAWQYDGAVEFYPENGDSYSISIFYKDITSFISEVTAVVDTGFVAAPFGPVIASDVRSRNRSGGSVIGFELAGVHNFDYLPGFWSGFGIQANYTFADSEDDEANDEFDQAAARAPDSGLEGFVKHTFNTIAFYENDRFQARVAYNWRDDYLARRFSFGGIAEHVEDYGQIDASAAYFFTDNVSVTLSGTNLTDEKVYRFADVEERVVLNSYSGRTITFGLRARF